MNKDKRIANILDLLLYGAKDYPNRIYCKSARHEFSYEQFFSASIELSKLITVHNLKDKPIAILLPNSILFLISYSPTLRLGNY